MACKKVDWLAHATVFSFTYEQETFTIEIRPQKAPSPPRWAVMWDGFVLNKKKNGFDYEPFPSSRTTAFLRNCRFASLEEAYAAFQVWCAARKCVAGGRLGKKKKKAR